MKKLRKVVCIGLFIFILVCLTSPVNAECSIVGKWNQNSFAGCVVDCYADGTCTQQILSNYIGPNTGTWIQNGNKVTINWDFKCCGVPQNFIDYFTLGTDCNSYSGINQYGDHFSGTRLNTPLIAVTPSIRATPNTLSSCSIVGQWNRYGFAGGLTAVFTYYTDGRVTYVESSGYSDYLGTWVSNGGGSYTEHWPHGPGWIDRGPGGDHTGNYIDYVTISPDCRSLTGINNYGDRVNSIRSQDQTPIITVTPTIPDTSITIHATPFVTTNSTIHGNSNSAGSQPENIFNNILLIPFIIVILILFIVGFLSLSRKKKYVASEEVRKTAAFNADSSENRLSATSTTKPSLHHDVFISYAHQNKIIADAICGTLETNRIRCWIAPRDILPGLNYQESIIDAIDNSRIMVLVYSSFTNNSPHITRELTRAVSKNVIIIPFRIEDVPLSKSMEYLISIPHWLDALTPPLEQHMEKLVQTVKVLLEKQK